MGEWTREGWGGGEMDSGGGESWMNRGGDEVVRGVGACVGGGDGVYLPKGGKGGQDAWVWIVCQRRPWRMKVGCRDGTRVSAHADEPVSTYEWQKKVVLHQVL